MKSTALRSAALPFAIAFSFTCAQTRANPAQDVAAQEQPAQTDSSQSAKLETISVNADVGKGLAVKTTQVGAFRDQNILDVPLSIAVMPRALMDAQAVNNIFDVLRNTAGVGQTQANDTVTQNLSIRGISIDNRTSYRLNGSLPVNNLIEIPMEDKERVEALKGSSALYYGFTSPAGIINMVTKRARDKPIAAFDITYDENGQTVGHVDVGRRFGDNNRYGLRVNLASGKLHTAAEEQDGSRSLASAAFDMTITDSVTFKLDYEDFHKRLVENSGIALLPAVNSRIALPHIPGADILLSGPWAKSKAASRNVLGRVDWMISDTWAAIIEWGRAYTRRDRSSTNMTKYNIDTGAGTLAGQLALNQQYVNNNSRIELAGRVQTGVFDHEISLGAMQNLRWANNPVQQTFSLAQNLYDPVQLPPFYFNVAKGTVRPQSIADRGIYVFDRIRIGEAWQLLAGARRTNYRSVSSVSPRYDTQPTSPSVGVMYKFREETNFYANYIEGLEEGGTAPTTAANYGAILPPAVSKQKELGMRTEAWSGMLFSASLFDIERGSAYTNTQNYYVADGRTHYQGLELSLNGELTPEWSIFSSALFLSAEQKRVQNTALLGKTPENTPDKTFSLFADYHPENLPGWSFNAGAYYMGERPVNNLNQADIPDYVLFGAGVRRTTSWFEKKVSLQLNIENLADKRYWSSTGNGYIGYGKPRTLKFTGRVEL